MRPALAAQLEFPGFFRVEEHYRLGPHQPVLGAPERDRVDPRLPGHLGRAASQCHQRVGKARAVQMGLEPVFAGNGGQGGKLVQRMNRPALGHLGD